MKWFGIVILVMIMSIVCGCNNRELEERGFPLAIAIDKSEKGMIVSFEIPDLSSSNQEKNPIAEEQSFSVEAGAYYEAQKAYENNSNRVLDYNHLKAIIISQDFMEDTKALRELLSWLEQEQIVARNTCLFTTKDQAATILTLTEKTGGSVGNYLQQMVETQDNLKVNEITTIGSLMNQWHNQNELLLIPLLINQGDIPVITEYMVMNAFYYKGSISAEDAMKVFLCQEQVNSFLYYLKSGEILEIEDIQRSVEIVDNEEKIDMYIMLTGQAKLKKEGEQKKLSKERIKKKLNQQLKKSLEFVATELKQNPGIDICNSFILLGGYERELYEKYQRDYQEYGKQLEYHFFVDMTIINE